MYFYTCHTYWTHQIKMDYTWTKESHASCKQDRTAVLHRFDEYSWQGNSELCIQVWTGYIILWKRKCHDSGAGREDSQSVILYQYFLHQSLMFETEHLPIWIGGGLCCQVISLRLCIWQVTRHYPVWLSLIGCILTLWASMRMQTSLCLLWSRDLCKWHM